MRFSFRRRPEAEVRELRVPWDVGPNGYGTNTHSGTRVDEQTALKYSVVWSAATLIADSVASLPAEALREGVKTDLPKWIRAPHRDLRRFDFWNQMILSLVLWGNAYARFVRRPSDGMPIGLDIIEPHRVTVEWDDRPGMAGFRRYKVDNGPWETSRDIFHLQGPTLPGKPKGMSAIAQARESIALGLTLEEFGARYFAQGSMAKIVLEVPQSLDPPKALAIVRLFEKFHRGKNNWHRPAIVSGGGKLHNISIPPEDAQFLESREFQAIDAARWFRVPPHRVGIVSKQSSWGSGLAEENMAMVQHTFKPWILRLEEALSAYSPGGEGLGLQIRLIDAGLLRGTAKEQADYFSSLYTEGIITKDEAREGLGYAPVGGEEGGFKKEPEPAAPGGIGAEPAGERASRHLSGKHNQKSHAGGRVHTGSKYDDLDEKGKKAVDETMTAWGITRESLDANIASRITPESLKEGRDWYREAKTFNTDLAARSGLTVEQTTAITSAVSPRMPWPQNKELAERIAMKHKDYADLEPVAAAKKIGGGLSANMAPAVAIARDGNVDKHLTGIKRRSFYNNMLAPGETDDVTVDVWMMRGARDASTKNMSDEDALKFVNARKAATGGAGAGYIAIADSVRRVAKEKGLSTEEVQAAYWVHIAGSKDGLWGRNG